MSYLGLPASNTVVSRMESLNEFTVSLRYHFGFDFNATISFVKRGIYLSVGEIGEPFFR